MYLLVILVLLFLLYLLIIKRRRIYNEYWKYILAIPGPKTWPLVGNVQMLLQNPEGIYEYNNERARTFYPIFKIWSFNISLVFLIRPEDIELVVTSMKHITKGFQYEFVQAWLGTGLLTSTDSKWQRRRKILTPAFHFTILQKFIDIFNRETDLLVETLKEICDNPYVDVTKPITEFTLNSIGETSLGVTLNSEPNCNAYKTAVHKFGELFTYRLVRPWLRIKSIFHLFPSSKEMTKILETLHSFSTNIIKKRKECYEMKQNNSYSERKRKALLDLLLNARYEEGVDIDDEGIREEVDTFMFEGHDTTSMAICYALVALANEPTIQKEVYQEIIEVLGKNTKHPDFKDLGELKYMERCIKESLRLYPSVPTISRILGEEIKTTTGYILPKGTNVNILIQCMHLSPNVWNDPEKFDPDRFLPENMVGRHPFAYLPFSAGPRNCIGQRFAILEIKAALCGILKNFILEPVDKPKDLKFKADLVLRPSGEIKVKFVPRK